MDIYPGTENDISEIILLMKSSLGEELIPKSETFFRWKHLENPFGNSKVLLARDGSRLVGLRTFMHWKWVNSKKEIYAVRAVDTATHNDYQGKGIFRKLTMQAVEESKNEGVQMIFNTPNPISKKGYLKMGWQEAGKMPLFFSPGSFLPRFFSDSLSTDILSEFDIFSKLSVFNINWSLSSASSNYHTPLDFKFIKWRYAACPVAKYGMISQGDLFGIIFRLKPLNKFIELRICEAWASSQPDSIKMLSEALKSLIKKIRPLVVSCTSSPLVNCQSRSLPGMLGPLFIGPVVTTRSLCMDDLGDFSHFKNWQPSIGSMELF